MDSSIKTESVGCPLRNSATRLSPMSAVASWTLQVIAAAILLQTLFFKFTGAEESRYIFSALGVEPWGRLAAGVVELIAALLLLSPAWCWLGALVAVAVMSGAIVSHMAILGIEVQGDGGLLFALALAVFVCTWLVLYIRRRQILPILRRNVSHFSDVSLIRNFLK